MPVLHQAIDGHWFVRYSVGQVWAAQVTPAGLEILRHLGVRKDGDTFDLGTLNQLKRRGLLTTTGAGGGGVLPPGVTTGGMGGIGENQGFGPLPLVFRRDDLDAWGLAIVVPPLPPEIAVAAAPTNATLQIDGRAIAAVELWPDNDRRRAAGVLVSVPPSEVPYRVHKLGSWPLDAPVWSGEIAGLNRADGEIFEAEEDGGERLAPDAPLYPGRRYIVVAPPVGITPHPATPPAGAEPIPLGRCGGWRAWDIRIPTHPEDQVNLWARHGPGWRHRVTAPPWRVQIVTPPLRFTVGGAAVLPAGQDALVRLAPPPNAHPNPAPLKLCLLAGTQQSQLIEVPRLGDQAVLVNLGPLPVGEALLMGLASDVEPLTLRTETPPAHTLLTEPGPLRLTVQVGAFAVTLDGLVGPQHDVRLPALEPEQEPSVIARCPVPLAMAWRHGRACERRTGLTATAAAQIILGALRSAWTSGAPVRVDLDAGAFGAISCRFVPAIRTARPAQQSPRAHLRTRWISTVSRRHTIAGDATLQEPPPRRLLGHARALATAKRRTMLPAQRTIHA